MQDTKTSVSDAAAQMYKNMKMGESAILDLMPKVHSETLRGDMVAHLEGYQSFAERAKALLDAEHKEAKDANLFAKASSKMGIAMNTMMDSTASHIAEMLIEGSTMGITDQMRIIHELERTGENGDRQMEETLCLAKEIVSFEEKNVEKMKEYL